FAPVGRVRFLDVVMLLLCLYAWSRKPRAGMVRPMRRTLVTAAVVTLASLGYGLARGGDERAGGWQVYLRLSTILASFPLAAVFRTPSHFVSLAKTIVFAGVHHAIMGILFYVFYIKTGRVTPLPGYLTTHDDTVLWTVGVGFLFLRAIRTPTLKGRGLAFLG